MKHRNNMLLVLFFVLLILPLAFYGCGNDEDNSSPKTGGTSNPTIGDLDYCLNSLCGAGEGDCDGDNECQNGLTCVNNVGANYGWDSMIDVCEQIGDGNDTFITATNISLGTSYNKEIDSSTDVDYFKFTTSSAGTITVSLTGLTANLDVKLYDSSQSLLNSSANSGTSSEEIIYPASNSGTFYVKVYGYNSATSNYTLTVDFSPSDGGGQLGRVFGYVYHQGTIPGSASSGISGVEVCVGSNCDTTGQTSTYDLWNVPVGQQTLTTTASGYYSNPAQVTVPEGIVGIQYDIEMIPSDGGSSSAVELYDGVPVDDDASSSDKLFFFNLDITNYYLTFIITHNQGELFSLFVNKPTSGDYPPPDGAGRDRDAVGSYGWMRVIFNSPAETGKYYIRVKGNGNFTIMAKLTDSLPKDPVRLYPETPISSDTSDGDKLYWISLGIGDATGLVIEITNTTGDVLDLGTNLPSTGHYPITVQNADRYAATSSGNERIVLPNDTWGGYEPGTYSILVEKYGSGGPFTIEAKRIM